METIYHSFLEAAKKHSQKTALLYKKEGKYTPITYQELCDSIDAVAAGLTKLGIGKGDSVGIFSYNRPEWVMADLAALKLGSVVVPIYHNLPASSVKYMINDSKIKLLLVENVELLTLIETIRKETPTLKKLVVIDDTGVDKKKRFLSFGEMNVFAARAVKAADVNGEDVATIVYTSGTTGEHKGVILSHWNIVSNARSAIKTLNAVPEDVIVSYLPACHMFERTCGYYAMLFVGGSIAFAEKMIATTVLQAVAEIKPTVMLALPRVVEKAHSEATRMIMEGPALQRALVSSAMKSLNTYANLKYNNEKIPLGLKIKHAVYNAIVGTKFRKKGGGRLRLIVSGGGALDKKIAKGFYVLGFNILEGYGLTETSPVVCVNTPEENILGTVGKPLDDVQVKIGEDSEILVKGPNVMKGYFNKPKETAKAIDKDGWFHTGDQGRFDEHGNLVITGRIKEIIVTSYGKNIASVPIEAKISHSPYIDQVVLFGDRRKCLVALIVPNQESVEDYAHKHNISFENYPMLLKSSEIIQLIEHEIDKVNARLVRHEQVKSFATLPEKFTIDNEMLTPTLKLRRGKIAKKYAGLIDAIYKNLEKRDKPSSVSAL